MDSLLYGSEKTFKHLVSLQLAHETCIWIDHKQTRWNCGVYSIMSTILFIANCNVEYDSTELLSKSSMLKAFNVSQPKVCNVKRHEILKKY